MLYQGPDIGGHPSWNLRAKTPRFAAACCVGKQSNAFVQVTCIPHTHTTLPSYCYAVMHRASACRTLHHHSLVKRCYCQSKLPSDTQCRTTPLPRPAVFVCCRQEAANVPWHQDSAYCHPNSWSTLQVGQQVQAQAQAQVLMQSSWGVRSGHASG